VTLAREPWVLPESLPFGDALIKPLRAGDTLNWKLT
jgi:dihydroorotase